MEMFKWKKKYGGIFLHWVAGYPSEDDLVKFLKKAKKGLMEPYVDKKDGQTYYSYIFICENVLPEGEDEYLEVFQKMRTRSTIEGLFERAKLTFEKWWEPFKCHDDQHEIMIWALK